MSSPYVLMISGSRDWTELNTIRDYLAHISQTKPDVLLLHGGCRGVDLLSEQVARQFQWLTQVYVPDWSFIFAAGPIRNARMLNEGDPDEVIAFPLGDSRGTRNAIDLAVQKLRGPIEQRGKLKIVRVIESVDQKSGQEHTYVASSELAQEEQKKSLPSFKKTIICV